METVKKLRNLTDLLDIVPCSRAHLYQAAKRGEIPTIKIGERIFVPGWYFDLLVSAGGRENQQHAR